MVIIALQTTPPPPSAAAPTTPAAQAAPAPAVAPATPPTPLTLAAATNAAFAANPANVAAQQQVVQAQARLAQVQAQNRYQFSLSSSAGLSNANVIQPPPSQETFYSVINTITLPLPVGRKPRLAVAQSNAQLAAAQAQFESAKLALAAQVSAAYYDTLRRQALRAIAADTLATAQRQFDDAQKRFNAGDVPELDVERARVPLATAQAGVDQAENAVIVGQETLNALLGRSLDDPTTVADFDEKALDDSPNLSLTLEEVRKRARAQSADVRAAQANVQAAEEAVGLAGLSREPTYALQASDTRSNDQTAFSRLNNLQATITIPLSDGGLANAQKSEARSALKAAQAQADAAGRTAEATASAAFRNAQSSRHQIAAARLARDIAQTTYDKTALGYREGLYPLSDTLTAQSALTQARIAYAQALYDAATAAATLNNALGVLP